MANNIILKYPERKKEKMWFFIQSLNCKLIFFLFFFCAVNGKFFFRRGRDQIFTRSFDKEKKKNEEYSRSLENKSRRFDKCIDAVCINLFIPRKIIGANKHYHQVNYYYHYYYFEARNNFKRFV